MIRDDFNCISDEELDKIAEGFNNALIKWFKNNHILENYVSYYIVERINCKFLFREKLDELVFSALNDLSQFCINDCDYQILNNILQEKYHLKIISEKPLDIVCLDQ